MALPLAIMYFLQLRFALGLVAPSGVSEICVINRAGFDVQMKMVNSDAPLSSPFMTPDMFPAPQTNCVSGLNLMPFPSNGSKVKCVVHVAGVAGTTHDCNGPTHSYCWWSKRRANYKCTGSTTRFSCDYIGTEDIVSFCTAEEQHTIIKNLLVKKDGLPAYVDDLKSCALRCLGGAPCTSSCIAGKEGYSSQCAQPMGNLIGCAVSHCSMCATSQGPSCLLCMMRNCVRAFLDGTGLAPTGVDNNGVPSIASGSLHSMTGSASFVSMDWLKDISDTAYINTRLTLV